MKELLDIYKEAKEKHGNDTLMIIRDKKDLYYMFGDDAKVCQEVAATNLFLVTDQHILMTYFYSDELDTYLPKLVRAGKRVAICG